MKPTGCHDAVAPAICGPHRGTNSQGRTLPGAVTAAVENHTDRLMGAWIDALRPLLAMLALVGLAVLVFARLARRGARLRPG